MSIDFLKSNKSLNDSNSIPIQCGPTDSPNINPSSQKDATIKEGGNNPPRSITLSKFTLAINDPQLDEEWSYTQITLKRPQFLIYTLYMVFVNLSADIPMFFNYGLKNVLILRVACNILSIILFYGVFHKNQTKMGQYFTRKQKQFYFIEAKNEKPKLKLNSQIEDQESDKQDQEESSLQEEYERNIKVILRNQRIQYVVYLLIVVINQLTHETLDPQEDYETLSGDDLHKYLRNKAFYLGISMNTIQTSLLVANINYLNSMVAAFGYNLCIMFYIGSHNYQNELLSDYVYCSIPAQILFTFLYYLDMKNSKMYFLSNLKNHRLMKDQIEIFNNLPDGLMIFQQPQNESEKGWRGQKIINDTEIDIKYLNKAISQMLFCDNQSTGQNQEVINNSKVVNSSEIWDKTNFKSKLNSLQKIYLKKTCYKIVDQKNVESSLMPLERPKNLIEHISNFENGQVYEIVFKTGQQNEFTNYTQTQRKRLPASGLSAQNTLERSDSGESKNYLVYLLRQKAFINDEEYTLTYFKDITFGVLYEQIKAQQELKNMINTTLQQKISVPLQACVKSCKNLRDSQQLQIIEQHQFRNQNLRNQLNGIMLQFKSVILKLNDMQDWQSLLDSRFMKKNIAFDLQEKLLEIQNLMRQMASNKNLKLIFETNFGTSQQIVQIVQYEQLLRNVLDCNEQIKDHPLLNYIPQINENQLLPKFMIGDPDRLQQVAINIITNAIQNTYFGKIVVYVTFDSKKSKLVFIVKDQGMGIKKEDQKTIFQLLSSVPKTYEKKNLRLSDGKQIGLGLFVSKQLVMNFGGQLDFISSQESGSTFIFTFEVEVDTNEEIVWNTAMEIQENQPEISPRFANQQTEMIDESSLMVNIQPQTSNFTLYSVSETVGQSFNGGTGENV